MPVSGRWNVRTGRRGTKQSEFRRRLTYFEPAPSAPILKRGGVSRDSRDSRDAKKYGKAKARSLRSSYRALNTHKVFQTGVRYGEPFFCLAVGPLLTGSPYV